MLIPLPGHFMICSERAHCGRRHQSHKTNAPGPSRCHNERHRGRRRFGIRKLTGSLIADKGSSVHAKVLGNQTCIGKSMETRDVVASRTPTPRAIPRRRRPTSRWRKRSPTSPSRSASPCTTTSSSAGTGMPACAECGWS